MVANCLRSAGASAYDTRDALLRHRLVFVYVTICLYCIAYMCTDIYVCVYYDEYIYVCIYMCVGSTMPRRRQGLLGHKTLPRATLLVCRVTLCIMYLTSYLTPDYLFVYDISLQQHNTI